MINEETDKWGRLIKDAEPWKHLKHIKGARELTALWLEGKSTFYPGYLTPIPDEETKLITDELVALNHAGLWTTGSQPGIHEGSEGLRQRNYVTGYVHIDVAHSLHAILNHTDLVYLFGGEQDHCSIPVSAKKDYAYTWLGRFKNLDDTDYFEVLARDTNLDFASHIRTQATEIQIFDPIWGRNDVLYPALLDALEKTPHAEFL